MKIEWLAGLLEGEGCFTYWHGKQVGYPVISVGMTDLDVIERIAQFWNKKVQHRIRKQPWKPFFVTAIGGTEALSQMLTLYPHMGNRRQQRIEDVLSSWEHSVAPRVK